MTQRPKLNSRVLRKKLTVLCPINRRRLNSTILRRLERPTKSPMLLNNLPMLSYKRLARRRSLREPTKKLMKKSQFLKLTKTWIKPRNSLNYQRTLFIELKNPINMPDLQQKNLKPKTIWRKLNTTSNRTQLWFKKPRLN